MPEVAVPPVRLTVTSVAAGRVPASSAAVTVTVVAPAVSATLAGLTLSRIAVGCESSSAIVSVAVSPVRPVALPLRITVSAPSAALSSVGVNVKFAVPLVWLAGMATVKSSSTA